MTDESVLNVMRMNDLRLIGRLETIQANPLLRSGRQLGPPARALRNSYRIRHAAVYRDARRLDLCKHHVSPSSERAWAAWFSLASSRSMASPPLSTNLMQRPTPASQAGCSTC